MDKNPELEGVGMDSTELTPSILGAVGSFIGNRINKGTFNSECAKDITISEITCEEFIIHVYDYMVRNFVIEKATIEKFSIGMTWLRKQNWKES